MLVASTYDLLELFIGQLLVVFGGLNTILHFLHLLPGVLAGLSHRVYARLHLPPLALELSGFLHSVGLLLL